VPVWGKKIEEILLYQEEIRLLPSWLTFDSFHPVGFLEEARTGSYSFALSGSHFTSQPGL